MSVLEEIVNKRFTYPQDVVSVYKSFTIISLIQPPNLSKKEYTEDMGKKMIWETLIKTYMKRLNLLEGNIRNIYTAIWGQCSSRMQSKLESLDQFEEEHNTCNCIWLVKEIQGITYQFEGTRNIFISSHNVWKNSLLTLPSSNQKTVTK